MLIILTFGCNSTKKNEISAKEYKLTPEKTKPIFHSCEEQSPNHAEFCTHLKLLTFLNKQFNYPAEAKINNVVGEVKAEYCINEQGEIMDINLLNNLGFGCDEEVVRILKTVPAFIPATINGKPVIIKDTMVFQFDGKRDPLSPIYQVVQYPAVFHGCSSKLDKIKLRDCGKEKMYKFVNRNLEYPKKAKINKVEGTVVIAFVVEKDGSIGHPHILKDLEYGCGAEALRVVKMMPDWTPAKHRGRNVRYKYHIPIRFKL